MKWKCIGDINNLVLFGLKPFMIPNGNYGQMNLMKDMKNQSNGQKLIYQR